MFRPLRPSPPSGSPDFRVLVDDVRPDTRWFLISTLVPIDTLAPESLTAPGAGGAGISGVGMAGIFGAPIPRIEVTALKTPLNLTCFFYPC